MSKKAEITEARWQESMKQVVLHMDGWQNILTGLGVKSGDHTESAKFMAREDSVNEQVHALYGQDGLFARIIDAVPEHSVRKWFRLTGRNAEGAVDEDWSKKIMQRMSKLAVKDAFREAQVLDRLDGVGYIVLGVNDGQKMDQPLKPEAVTEVRFIQARGKSDLQPAKYDEDVDSAFFGEPEQYRYGSGSLSIHRSRVIRFRAIRKPGQLRSTHSDVGIAYADRVYETIRSFGTLYGYIQSMFKDLSVATVTINGLNRQMSTQKGNDNIIKRLQLMVLCSSTMNFIPLDEGEKYERASHSLAGVSDLVSQAVERLSAVSGIPITILFGQSPHGLSTDDKSGRTTFYDGIVNVQESRLDEPAHRIIDVIASEQKAKIANYSLTWLPLEEENEKETAERRKTESETDGNYLDHEVIQPKDVFNRLKNDPDSPYELDEFEELDNGEDLDLDLKSAQGDNIDDVTKPGVADDVQSTLPNGAQLSEQRELIKDVANGLISRQSGLVFLMTNFGFDLATANAMLGPEDFKPRASDANDQRPENRPNDDPNAQPPKKTPPNPTV